MRTGVYGSRKVRDFHLLQPLGRKSCSRYRQIEDLGNGSSDGTFVCHLVSENQVIGHDTPLAIGRSGQIIQPRFTCQRMRIFDGIAYGINRFVGSLKVFVHFDSPHLAQLDSGFYGQSGFRTYTDGKNHQVGFQTDAGLELHRQPFGRRLESFHPLLQEEFHPFLQQMLVYQRRHGIIYRPHHLVGHFYHRHLGTGMVQVLGHLQTDKSAAHDNCPTYTMLLQVFLDTVCIIHIAQGEDTRKVDAGQGRTYRRSSRRKQKLVVRFTVLFPVGSPHTHLLLLPVDGYHLRTGTYINIEPAAKCLRSLYEQPVTVFYHTTYIIRQTTIGIRNVFSPFKKNYGCFFGISTDTGSSRCTSGHSTYYNIFHHTKACLNCF